MKMAKELRIDYDFTIHTCLHHFLYQDFLTAFFLSFLYPFLLVASYVCFLFFLFTVFTPVLDAIYFRSSFLYFFLLFLLIVVACGFTGACTGIREGHFISIPA